MTRFAPRAEALGRFFGGARARRKQLERDHPSELQVLSAVDHSHTAGAERLRDLVVSDGLSNHRIRHGNVP